MDLAYWISEHNRGVFDAIQKDFNKSTEEVMT